MYNVDFISPNSQHSGWTLSECRRDSRSLCWTVNSLLSPPLQCTSEKLAADQFTESLRTKVDSIRTATDSADPPVIVTRRVPPLSYFKPATVPEILWKCQPSRASCIPLRHGYSNSLHRTLHLSSVISVICPSKVVYFPASLKHARVRPLLKKSTMDWITGTQISVCKSPFPSAGTTVSLFRAKTVQQRPLLPREVETALPDCGVTH